MEETLPTELAIRVRRLTNRTIGDRELVLGISLDVSAGTFSRISEICEKKRHIYPNCSSCNFLLKRGKE